MSASRRPLPGWVEIGLLPLVNVALAFVIVGVIVRIIGVEPNVGTGTTYELRFRAPGAGANTALLGLASSPFTNGMQRISNIVLGSGANLRGLNLPIDPNGVVYNSMARTPIAGATLTPGGPGSTLTLGNVTTNGNSVLHLNAGTYVVNSLTMNGSSKVIIDSGPVIFQIAGVGVTTPLTITGNAYSKPGFGDISAADAGETVTLPGSGTNGGRQIVGPFPQDRFNNSSGQVSYTLDNATGMTVAAVKLKGYA